MNTPTADDVLAKLGLQTRMSARDYLFPALGIFGLGMLVGAGIVAISVPTVRHQVRDRLRRAGTKVRDMSEQAREKMEGAAEQIKERVTGGNGHGRSQHGEDFQSMTREQLLERAKSMNLQTRANMSKNELIDALNAR
jgi:hypothetical protein